VQAEAKKLESLTRELCWKEQDVDFDEDDAPTIVEL
jgi:hypothetical protein